MQCKIEQKKLKKNFELKATTSNYFQRFWLSIFVARLKKNSSFISPLQTQNFYRDPGVEPVVELSDNGWIRIETLGIVLV
jgi:hypothetical protein